MAMNPTTRRQLLDKYFALNASLEDPAVADLVHMFERRTQLRLTYEAEMPRVALSRCPFTGELYAPPFDSGGLDGLFWNFHSPIRPRFTPPVTLLALTGAMQLAPNVEAAPFLVMPGPSAPYIYPRMLRDTGIKAVIYSFPMQRHTAIAIAYFGLERPPYLAMPNLWGTGHYEYEDSCGTRNWYESGGETDHRDYDLRPWVETGAVQWIAPADSLMELQSGAGRCPYLNMPGERQDQYIYQGVRT